MVIDLTIRLCSIRSMNYREATTAARTGSFIRHPGMGPGWTIGVLSGHGRLLWCLNPHTGSEYQYSPADSDQHRADWFVSKTRTHMESLHGKAHKSAR